MRQSNSSSESPRLLRNVESTPAPIGVTEWLQAWADGSSEAQEQLFELVYPELRRIARQHLAGKRFPNIQVTDVVHETYLRLVDQRQCEWACREHFYAVSATLVRRILIDHAKHLRRRKRGQGAVHVSLDDVELGVLGPGVDVMALDQALVELAGIRMTAARIVELRYFAGLSFDEAAQVMGLSRSTALRKWRFAKAWLAKRLGAS